MKRRLVALIALMLSLCGCQKQENRATTPAEPPKKAPVVMYEGAIKDYLGDGYNYSWERVCKPEYVMIHFCSAVIKHANDPYNISYIRQGFLNDDVSIHYVIGRNGKIYCYVPEDRVAWHAGAGTWKDDAKYFDNMNYYSIGIELVGMGSYQDMSIYMSEEAYAALEENLIAYDEVLFGFTDAQYEALKLLVADICERNEIPLDRDHIIGHEEYSPHKNDPGELFDWSRIIP